MKCFAMMPFGGYFDGYWKDVIKPTLVTEGYEAIRADEIYTVGAIIMDVYNAIFESELCIADVTNKNPNVSYELGMAHAMRKPTILITQRIEDIPFDYRHLRHILYNPMESGWQTNFIDTIKKTINEIRTSPSRNIVIKDAPEVVPATDFNVLRKHIQNIFLSQAQDIRRENNIFIEGPDSGLIKTTWKIKAKSRMHHICYNIVCDKPGEILLQKSYDVTNARELEYVIHEQSSNHRTFFILFREPKESGHSFHIETEVYAPGYFDVSLLDVSEGALMSTQATSLGVRYELKIDKIHFPKKPEYATITAEITNHPREELIGTLITVRETEYHYALEMVYDAKEPYQHETACRIKRKV